MSTIDIADKATLDSISQLLHGSTSKIAKSNYPKSDTEVVQLTNFTRAKLPVLADGDSLSEHPDGSISLNVKTSTALYGKYSFVFKVKNCGTETPSFGLLTYCLYADQRSTTSELTRLSYGGAGRFDGLKPNQEKLISIPITLPSYSDLTFMLATNIDNIYIESVERRTTPVDVIKALPQGIFVQDYQRGSVILSSNNTSVNVYVRDVSRAKGLVVLPLSPDASISNIRNDVVSPYFTIKLSETLLGTGRTVSNTTVNWVAFVIDRDY